MNETTASERERSIKAMVDRFLGWKLPKTFAPDCGITFAPHQNSWPIGTNLLTATEARAMVEHMLSDAPSFDDFDDFLPCGALYEARAALPAPADQPPEPQGSSGSLSESGVEARTQDAASASGSLSEIRRTAQVAEAAWWCKNAVRHVRFVSIDAASSIDDRAAAVRAAEEAIDKLAALL